MQKNAPEINDSVVTAVASIVAEIATIKNADFEKLKVSTHSPSDEEAQTALVHCTDRKLTDVIINQS
jgi:hypothetical protein